MSKSNYILNNVGPRIEKKIIKLNKKQREKGLTKKEEKQLEGYIKRMMSLGR